MSVGWSLLRNANLIPNRSYGNKNINGFGDKFRVAVGTVITGRPYRDPKFRR
jgi:hypothetical protein